MNRWIRNRGTCSPNPMDITIGALVVVLLSLYVATNCIEDTRNQQMALLHQSRIKISDLETQLAICNTTWQDMRARFECNVADLDIAQWQLIQMKSALEEALETLEVYKERERESSNDSRTIHDKNGEIAPSERSMVDSETSLEEEGPRALNWAMTAIALLIMAIAMTCYCTWGTQLHLQLSSKANSDSSSKAVEVQRRHQSIISRLMQKDPKNMIFGLEWNDFGVEWLYEAKLMGRTISRHCWRSIPIWISGKLHGDEESHCRDDHMEINARYEPHIAKFARNRISASVTDTSD